MTKALLFIFSIIVFQSCQTSCPEQPATANVAPAVDTIVPNVQIAEKVETEAPFGKAKHWEAYQNLKSRIKKDRNQLRNRTDITAEDKLQLAQSYIAKTLVDSIFPYWVGTPWDFNGYTEKPLDGEVACGYFVSTTLRDVGIQLNRYKVAQKAAADIIVDLCGAASIQRFDSFEQLERFVAPLQDTDIIIVGLDFHVGFIFKKEGQAYFAHSNYIGRKGVELEILNESDALKNTGLYVVGNLVENEARVKTWLNL